MSDWQYTNPFYEEGKQSYLSGGSLRDNPYDYTKVEDKDVQQELYRQNEWQAGFFNEHMLSIGAKKIA